jgi:hypothetical protein
MLDKHSGKSSSHLAGQAAQIKIASPAIFSLHDGFKWF